MKNVAKFDLTLVSDEDLKREYMRRFNARRARGGGRPVKLRLCPHCGAQFGAVALRDHLGRCKARNTDAAPPEPLQAAGMRLKDAQAKLRAHLGAHASMRRVTDPRTGQYVFVSRLGLTDIVSPADQALSVDRCLQLTLLHCSPAQKG